MKKIFITILVLCAVLSTLKPDITYSNNENRNMQTFPKSSILDAQWMSDFDKYTSDQFIFRDQWLSIKTYTEMITLKKCINNVYITSDRLLNNYTDADFDDERVKYNIDAINNFVKKYNANLYLIPTSSEIYKDDLPFYANNIDINKKLEGLENYTDMYDILNKYKNEDIYYKTDHHWTTLGAYYAYQNMFENPVEFNKKLISDEFLGTIHSKLNIKFEPDEIYINDSKTDFDVFYDLGKEDLGLYFDKYLEGKDKYSYFLDNNHGLIQIVNNDVDNDKSIVIIKDSFSNCLAPFIAENYKNVYLIDLRYFNINVSTFLKTIEYDDIYVIYNKVNFLQDENFVKFK